MRFLLTASGPASKSYPCFFQVLHGSAACQASDPFLVEGAQGSPPAQPLQRAQTLYSPTGPCTVPTGSRTVERHLSRRRSTAQPLQSQPFRECNGILLESVVTRLQLPTRPYGSTAGDTGRHYTLEGDQRRVATSPSRLADLGAGCMHTAHHKHAVPNALHCCCNRILSSIPGHGLESQSASRDLWHGTSLLLHGFTHPRLAQE